MARARGECVLDSGYKLRLPQLTLLLVLLPPHLLIYSIARPASQAGTLWSTLGGRDPMDLTILLRRHQVRRLAIKNASKIANRFMIKALNRRLPRMVLHPRDRAAHFCTGSSTAGSESIFEINKLHQPCHKFAEEVARPHAMIRRTTDRAIMSAHLYLIMTMAALLTTRYRAVDHCEMLGRSRQTTSWTTLAVDCLQ
jgi:hypothetical protein